MKSERKKIEDALDKVCSELTIKRDGCCQVCGSMSKLAAHHCYGRRHMSVRWDPDNLITLCWPHHKHFAHGDPVGFATWLSDKIGEPAYQKLKVKARSIVKRSLFDLHFLLSERKKQLLGDRPL